MGRSMMCCLAVSSESLAPLVHTAAECYTYKQLMVSFIIELVNKDMH